VTWVGGTHHVLGIELLLSKLGNSQGTVLLGSTTGQWGKTNHEKVKTWEWDQVDCKFAKVSVQLTWETEAASAPTHGGGHKVVQVTVGWSGEFEGTEANIVQGFVVKDHNFIGVLNKLVHGKSGVVWLNDGIRHLW
jgi:hypothetical protein